jgi:GT2 family glycosyltransferase
MKQIKIAVVIPTFNRKDITEKCVANLLKGTFSNIKIIICDSDSSDGTQEALQNIDNVSVINVGEDSWWSAAVNEGVSVALTDGCEYILVLNDDIDIPNSLIKQLLDKAIQNPGKIITPAQKNKQGIFLGIKYNGIFKSPSISWCNEEHEQVNVGSSNGCCLLIQSDVFRKVGLFDDKCCPHLYGDTEFQLRSFNSGVSTMAFSDILITQQEGTDYCRRLRFGNLLTYKGSPVHLAAYLAFGRSLFNGWFGFIFLGARHHYTYIRSLIKTMYIIFYLVINKK